MKAPKTTPGAPNPNRKKYRAPRGSVGSAPRPATKFPVPRTGRTPKTGLMH